MIAQVYDTILSIPGMGEVVKIDLRIPRKNALLLSSVIDRGLNGKDGEKVSGLLSSVSKETLEELKSIATEFLDKAGLMELNEKLKSLAKV